MLVSGRVKNDIKLWHYQLINHITPLVIFLFQSQFKSQFVKSFPTSLPYFCPVYPLNCLPLPWNHVAGLPPTMCQSEITGPSVFHQRRPRAPPLEGSKKAPGRKKPMVETNISNLGKSGWYPPGNDHISNLGKVRKIIDSSLCLFGRGYVKIPGGYQPLQLNSINVASHDGSMGR